MGVAGLVVEANGNINWDSGTLYLDLVNNRVGILTTSPTDLLHIRDRDSTGLDGILLEHSGSTFDAFTVKVIGESFPRFRIQVDGMVLWGFGTGAEDTVLYRLGPNNLATDDSLTISRGSITTDVKVLEGTVTWNAGGVIFTGLRLNVTDTASAAASLLADLQVGGVSKFKVDKAGTITALNHPTAPTQGFMRALVTDAASLTAVTAFATQDAYYVYLGRLQHPVTSCNVVCRVTTAAATITYAEVAIFTGPPVANGAASLTRRGFTDVSATFNSTGIKNTAVTLTGTTAGDDVWVVFASQATTPFQLRGCLADDIQSGIFQTTNGVRPSTAASPQATTLAGAAVVPPWVTVKF